VSKGCTHQDYPEGYDGCVRTETMMIGYLFSPAPEIKGTKMQFIYVENLQGNIPGKMVQDLENLMHYKIYNDLKRTLKKYQKNDLNLNDQDEDEYAHDMEEYN
jgi:hypothetical protein